MARRFQTRGISKDRVYTIKMAARTVGVSEQTFRQWHKDGLHLISDKRPYLVRGADLIDFLKKREKANKVPMCKGQFFCMACKAPRDARKGSITYSATTALTGRLSGLCAVCGGKLGQFCRAASSSDFMIGDAAPPSAGAQA